MGVSIMQTHSDVALKWINDELRKIGVNDYRFCIENDCYICDRYGAFYSVCKRQQNNNGTLREEYKITKLNGSIDKYGYVTYRMIINGKKKHMKAHRLMLNAWVGPHPELVVNHMDGNKKNNSLNNLEWCTVADNNRHAIETGLLDFSRIKYIHKIPIYEWMTIYVLYHHCNFSLSELGRMYGVVHDSIKRIIVKVDKVMPEVVKSEQPRNKIRVN